MLQCLPEPPDSWLASCLRKSILRDACGGGGGGGGSAISGVTTTTVAEDADEVVVMLVVVLVVVVVVVVVLMVVLLYVDIWASSTLTERFNIFIECSSIHLYKKYQTKYCVYLKKKKSI